jgi:acyl-CoA hydrolase
MEMIKVADSRFQDELLKQAKAAGMVPAHYEIPPEYRNNYPEKYESLLKPYQVKATSNHSHLEQILQKTKLHLVDL